MSNSGIIEELRPQFSESLHMEPKNVNEYILEQAFCFVINDQFDNVISCEHQSYEEDVAEVDQVYIDYRSCFFFSGHHPCGGWWPVDAPHVELYIMSLADLLILFFSMKSHSKLGKY